MRKIFQISRRIFTVGSASAETPAQEMQRIICEALQARRDDGAARAVHAVARDLGISASMITEIVRGRVGRVWADEWMQARQWHARECERQAQRLEHQAELYRVRSAALRKELGKCD